MQNLCIADLTNYNPNVFYELAVAQTANRPVIILIKKGQKLPFDVSDLRCVTYDLEIRSYKEKTFIKRIINFIREFEASNWKTSDIFKNFRTLYDIYFEPITERKALYERATDMIKNAKRIFDTTWGRVPKKLSKQEEEARNIYREAIEIAITNGAEYRDLFSKTQKRLDELHSTAETFKDYPKYEARCIEGMTDDLPVVDFLITDNDEVLLSHVAFKGAVPIPKYLYVKSKLFADFYSGLFNECWDYSQIITDNNSG